jgi:ribosome-binding protein aMBF1 (putative translation factor)
VITGAQIRAARGLLGWSASDLATKSGTTRFTVQRLEQHDGIPPSRSQTLADLQRAFEEAGVEFIGTPEQPGVILKGVPTLDR